MCAKANVSGGNRPVYNPVVLCMAESPLQVAADENPCSAGFPFPLPAAFCFFLHVFPFCQYGKPFQIRKHFCRALYSPNAKIVMSSDNMVSGVTETSVFPARLMSRMLMPNFLRTSISPTLFSTHAPGTCTSKDGVPFVDLYVVENVVSSESNRCPFCHLLFGVEHIICAVAEQKLRLHIALGAGYHAFGPQLLQQ